MHDAPRERTQRALQAIKAGVPHRDAGFFITSRALPAAHHQPISRSSGKVRSYGGLTTCRRSALIDGSISWFGVASVV